MKNTPGPLAPPDNNLPSLKMTALSYSCTTFTTNIRDSGSETRMRRTEMSVSMWAQRPGPSLQSMSGCWGCGWPLELEFPWLLGIRGNETPPSWSGSRNAFLIDTGLSWIHINLYKSYSSVRYNNLLIFGWRERLERENIWSKQFIPHNPLSELAEASCLDSPAEWW